MVLSRYRTKGWIVYVDWSTSTTVWSRLHYEYSTMTDQCSSTTKSSVFTNM